VRVLVDTNVLLDVLAERKPFYPEAVRIWTLAESQRLDAHVAAISFTNCYYLVRKHADQRSADKAVRLLRDVFTPVDLTARIITQAIDSGLGDFEDAIQFHSAVCAGAECVITRNPDHFPKAPLSILTPAEFLAVHKFE
jgi:predicted nucleic acid-binding protein